MKTILRATAGIVLGLATIWLGFFAYRMGMANATAHDLALDFCNRKGLNRAFLSVPSNIQMNAAAAYALDYNDTTNHYEILVHFNRWYEPEIAIWDYKRND